MHVQFVTGLFKLLSWVLLYNVVWFLYRWQKSVHVSFIVYLYNIQTIEVRKSS